MTREEFAQEEDAPCQQCGSRVALEHNPNNNAIQVVCSNRMCSKDRLPWGRVINIKQNNKKRRADYPAGNDLDEVWARHGDVCFMCSITKEECEMQGVGRQRHHVLEYAKTGHQGPIYPICSQCHPIATNLQRIRAFIRKTIQSLLNTDAEPVTGSSPEVSGSGVSPDPVRPKRQTAISLVERLPDDDADD